MDLSLRLSLASMACARAALGLGRLPDLHSIHSHGHMTSGASEPSLFWLPRRMWAPGIASEIKEATWRSHLFPLSTDNFAIVFLDYVCCYFERVY